ncbi:IS110 family transposase [Peribacillus deserti]|uniref:IS110 family transposase n=1 Tax=Peribacillus deserti TaxID=673318 RepID=UPI001959FABD
MESTSVYWKPIVNLLESEGIEFLVVYAQHMKSLPGRKTDVKDAEWIAQLLRHGLLKASFIPNRTQRELWELVRYRRALSRNGLDSITGFKRCSKERTSNLVRWFPASWVFRQRICFMSQMARTILRSYQT